MSADHAPLAQEAPWPYELEKLVNQCIYRKHEGWRVALEEDTQRDEVDGKIVGHGTTLAVYTKGYNTYHPEQGTTYRVVHYFIVPAATYNRASWKRWLFEQLAKVEVHECMENFILRTEGEFVNEAGETVDHYDERPFAPTHGKGDDPYVVHEFIDEVARRTRYTDVASVGS